MNSKKKLFVGIDGGGTGSHALLCDSEMNILGKGSAGPANIVTDFQFAIKNVVAATQNALSDAGLSEIAIEDVSAFLGLAGGNHIELKEQFNEMLPFRNSFVDTDAVSALQGAIGDEEGMVALIGTGTVYIYRIDGEIRTAGGWGFMVGDLASGAWLGRQLLQEVLQSYDGIHLGSDLTRHVLQEFENNPETVVEYAQTAKPGEFGRFAPIIFEYAERRDPIASDIVKSAIAHIEENLDVILTRESSRFCMLGGLGGVYTSLLSKYYRDRVSSPNSDGVTGAAELAIKHFGDQGATR